MELRPVCIAVSLLALSSPALAADISQLQTLNQGEFRSFSEDLAAALSYKPLTPTAPLGVTGFDLGAAVTATQLQNSAVFDKASGGNFGSTLALPSVHLDKGLPLDLDVGLMASAVPGTNIRLWGGELRYALVPGDAVWPAIGIRGSYTRVSGVDQLDFDTKGLDLSISKGFAMLTPYVGVGRVWTTSTPEGIAGLSKESFSLGKVFGGLNLNLGFMNLAFEADRTGNANSFGVKAGFRF